MSVDLKGVLHLLPATGSAAQKSGDFILFQECLQFRHDHLFAMCVPGLMTEGIPVQNILVGNTAVPKVFSQLGDHHIIVKVR